MDTTTSIASSYACQNCCPDSFYDASCLPDPITGLPGDTVQFQARERDIACYGNISDSFDVSGFAFISWASADAAVAAVDGNGLGTARSPGSTLISASWEATMWHFDLVHGLCKDTIVQALARAACDVLARISVE